MTHVTATLGEFRPHPSISSSATMRLVLAALALASGSAAWLAVASVSLVSGPAFLKDASRLAFEDRFSRPSKEIPTRPPAQSVLRELDIKLQEAKGRLAQKLRAPEWRAALIAEPTPLTVTAVPLPRSRPAAATLELRNAPPTAQSDDRTFLQRISDLLPGHITLASLGPDSGSFSDGPDLAALGYDNFTAVYDISAHAVYLPNGSKLEAHSGFGGLMDDPEHVSERDVGATPPNVYDLKTRERLFHGVQALRMIPVDEKGMLGRSGLLAHGYMLGPKGDSNGCVSIKSYERFLKAFQNGEIRRLVVVTSLYDGGPTSRRSTS